MATKLLQASNQKEENEEEEFQLGNQRNIFPDYDSELIVVGRRKEKKTSRIEREREKRRRRGRVGRGRDAGTHQPNSIPCDYSSPPFFLFFFLCGMNLGKGPQFSL